MKRLTRRRNQHGYIVQFLLLVAVGVLVIGSIVAWKMYSNRKEWREWTMGLRSGLIGMNSGRATEDEEDDFGDELESESIRYLGQGYAELGQFSIACYDTITNTTLTVRFQLKGMTPCTDEASFNEFMHDNATSFRDRVTQAIRDCRRSDFTDAKRLGKKVAVRVNRAFSQRFLESAELAEFDVIESVGTYQSEPWHAGGQVARDP